MYVCMYVCTYVRMYVCMYVHTYVCTYVCTYECMYVCMYVRMHIRTYVCMYGCTYVCTGTPMCAAMTVMYSALRTVRTYLYEGIGGEHSSSTALVGTNGSLHLRTKNTGKRLLQYIQTYICAVHTKIHTYVCVVRTYEHMRCTYIHTCTCKHVRTCATVYVRMYVCAQATNHFLYVDVVCICWAQYDDVQLGIFPSWTDWNGRRLPHFWLGEKHETVNGYTVTPC